MTEPGAIRALKTMKRGEGLMKDLVRGSMTVFVWVLFCAAEEHYLSIDTHCWIMVYGVLAASVSWLVPHLIFRK